MNVRYPLKCHGCGSITVLRIGVSYREREPFEFACQECSQDISGIHVTDQKRYRVVGVEDLSGAEQAHSEEGAKFYHQYHPDFATDTTTPTTPTGLGMSPFLQAMRRRGLDDLVVRVGRGQIFAETVQRRGNDIIRALRNHQKARWKQFDTDAQRLGIRLQPPADASSRLCAVSEVVNLLLSPIFQGGVHSSRVADADALLRNLASTDPAKLTDTLESLLSEGFLTAVQQQLLDIFARVVRLGNDLRPVLFEWDPENDTAPWPEHLAVKGPMRFHDLKTLYVDAYEALARALTAITALLNLRDRGGAANYAVHPDLGKKFSPKTLREFHKQNNAPKLAYLRGDPLFEPWILPALDPKLRNAIGHYSADYDPVDGRVSYIVDKATGKREELSYGEFMWGLTRILFCCFETHELLRTLLVLAQGPIPEDVSEMASVGGC
jgi:hypothetical protein